MLRWRREEKKREERGERGETCCKLAVILHTRIKKLCERDKWAMY
jgi:hypothetical protein